MLLIWEEQLKISIEDFNTGKAGLKLLFAIKVGEKTGKTFMSISCCMTNNIDIFPPLVFVII